MIASKSAPMIIMIAAFTAFITLSATRPLPQINNSNQKGDRVVLSPALQILVSGGDPFLAANFEVIRAASTWDGAPEAADIDANFRVRLYQNVSRLNPCHEDNYYQGNALLSWSGAPTEGGLILKRAMNCRTWDDMPAFFYGFNRYYFFNDKKEAHRALEIAAERSKDNKAVMKKMAIMIEVSEQPNTQAALNYLKNEKQKSRDPNLKAMLEKRIIRLGGLLTLHSAQQRYEAQFGKPLEDPNLLISNHILSDFPKDPLKIGYAFENGRFKLNTRQ